MLVSTSDKVRHLVAAGEYKKALKIAKEFRLGISREDSVKMSLAYENMIYPGFYRQIGIDPESAIEEGIRVLKVLYGRREEQQCLEEDHITVQDVRCATISCGTVGAKT